MKNTLRLNHATRTIVMDATFARYAADTMSSEYAHLQKVRMDYPTYTVERRRITQNAAKECYRGLTYTYMKEYIITHGTRDDLKTYAEMKLISECHSEAFRYPTIKAWFLKRFPEIKAFGVKADAAEEIAEDAANDAPITNLPVDLGTAV